MPSPDSARVTTRSSHPGSGPAPPYPPDYELAPVDARSFSPLLHSTSSRCRRRRLPRSFDKSPPSGSRLRLFHVVGWGVVEFGVLLLGLVVLGHIDVLDE